MRLIDSPVAIPMPNNARPLDDAQMVQVSYTWDEKFSYQIDLRPARAQGEFDEIQSVYIDNSANAYPVALTSMLGQKISVAAFSCGVYPVTTREPLFNLDCYYQSATNTGAFGQTDVYFMNTFQVPRNWSLLENPRSTSVNTVLAAGAGFVNFTPFTSPSLENQKFIITGWELYFAPTDGDFATGVQGFLVFNFGSSGGTVSNRIYNFIGASIPAIAPVSWRAPDNVAYLAAIKSIRFNTSVTLPGSLRITGTIGIVVLP